MLRFAKSALMEAKRYIGTAECSQSTTDSAKLDQTENLILVKVDSRNENRLYLKNMDDAFLQKDDVLENKEPARLDRAEKGMQKTAVQKQEPNRLNSAVGTVTMTSLGVPQIAVSVANDSAAPRTPLVFSKKADRESFVCHLPAPGEELKSTRQLAYCLALLQESVDVTCLKPATLEWRCNTLKDPDEVNRLKNMTCQILTEFIEDRKKNTPVVEEVVQLAQVLQEETVRSLLESLVDTVSKSTLLHLHAMEGLARVIQCATKGSIQSSDFVKILEVLYTRLQTIHDPSTSDLCRLLHAISRVLDAMILAQVEDVDRITLHGPLTTRLHELESHQDPCVAFQAKYASRRY
ncbi:hypothetical protein EC968_005940 [Mortierella alpina]|nr:hypothetical protein EC968_005940 [Mortierella alpina]